MSKNPAWQQPGDLKEEILRDLLEAMSAVGFSQNHINKISTIEELRLILSVGINVLDQVGWTTPAESMLIAASKHGPEYDEDTSSTYYLYAAIADGIREANE